ncbi:hypothetical protein D3C80_1739910 [compost metagenome]
MQFGRLRQQAIGLLQGAAGAEGEVDGGKRALVGLELAARHQQQWHAAVSGDTIQAGAGEEIVALMMGAQHQQVATELVHLLQHGLGRFAADQPQLAARRGIAGQAAIQGLMGLFMLLAALGGVEDV